MKTPNRDALDIVTDPDPLGKLIAELEMDRDGLACITTEAHKTAEPHGPGIDWGMTPGQLAAYARGILEPMSARVLHYVEALDMLAAIQPEPPSCTICGQPIKPGDAVAHQPGEPVESRCHRRCLPEPDTDQERAADEAARKLDMTKRAGDAGAYYKGV